MLMYAVQDEYLALLEEVYNSYGIEFPSDTSADHIQIATLGFYKIQMWLFFILRGTIVLKKRRVLWKKDFVILLL
jgi:hypothetical protein